MMRLLFRFAGPALLAAGVTAGAAAQSTSHSAIQDSALAGASGHVAVNNSAGTGNAQANMAVIGIGTEHASAAVRSRQHTRHGERSSGTQVAAIEGGAFRGASGIVTVNQASGSGNAQANLVAIAAGALSEVSIDQLGSVSAGQETQPAAASREQRAAISDSAFAGANGIVQVNQLAGSGNNTANVFALSIGASPH